MTPVWRSFAAALLVFGALGVFVGLRMEVTGDITHFLPGDETDRELVALSKRIAESELTRTMVLLIEAPDTETAVRASRAFEAALREDPRVSDQLAVLEGGPPDGVDRALWELYQPRRLAFLARDAEAARARLTDAALREAARDLKARLATPMSTVISRVAPADPLLIVPKLFEGMDAGRAGGMALVDGRFVTADGRHAVLFVATKAPAFDSSVQRPLLAAVDEAFAKVDAAEPAELTLQQSGVNRFAVRAEAAIEADIRRVSIASVVALMVLFTLLFRSLRLVALAGLPIGAGMLAGCAAVLLVFDRIHGLTLAFGAALIGVCIDYAVHFYCHHAIAPAEGGPRKTLDHIWPGVALGAATTMVGFVALGWSSFPGLSEVALFATVGVFGALCATRWLMPPLMPTAPKPVRLQRRLADALGRSLRWLRGHRAPVWALVAAVAVVLAVGLPMATWQDDISDLQQLDPELKKEDEAVREQIARFEQRRFVVALGDDLEAALQANDRVFEALGAARSAGEVGGFRNLGDLLPSAARQREVAAAVRGVDDLWPRLKSALAAEDFRPELFEPFHEALEGPAPEPLRFADLMGSPLASMARTFEVTVGDQVGVLTFLHDVKDAAALQRRLQAVEGARLLDQQAVMTSAYGAYRERMVELVLLGLLAVLGLVVARYRNAGLAAAAFAPALVAAALTVAVLSMLGVSLNVLTLTALLMVLSVGVDYGVFLAEASARDKGVDATLLSLVVACLTTVFGFGLLGLSDHPALRSLGLTAGVGVLASLLMAPTVLILTRPREET